jgi:hypothetical protein
MTSSPPAADLKSALASLAKKYDEHYASLFEKRLTTKEYARERRRLEAEYASRRDDLIRGKD